LRYNVFGYSVAKSFRIIKNYLNTFSATTADVLDEFYYRNMMRMIKFVPLIVVILLPIIYIDLGRIQGSSGDIKWGAQIIFYSHLAFLALLLLSLLILKVKTPESPKGIKKIHSRIINGFIFLFVVTMAGVAYGDVITGNSIASYIGAVFLVAILFFLPVGFSIFLYFSNSFMLYLAISQLEISALISLSQYINLISFTLIAFSLSTYLFYLGTKDFRHLREKDRFLSIIAHDLRAPFNSLIGFSDVMIEDFDDMDDSVKKELIESIGEVSKETYQLLENLLNWSRSQTGQMELEKQRHSVSKLLNQTFELQSRLAEEKSIALTSSIADDVMLFGDENTIITSIRNLISNAIKFTGTGGSIRISTSSKNGKTRIHIQDNGVGMDQHTVGNLFRTDKKISTLGTNNEKGSGLGLVLCKEFIQINSGNISVNSSPGKGSTFTVSLPDHG
jgi:signal transduction histidine kinase